MEPRPEPKDVPDDGNPVSGVRHTTNGSNDECLGLALHLWCPGCQALHAPRFICKEHGGPKSGPIWVGDPTADPIEFSPSLLVQWSTPEPLDSTARIDHRCHSFVRDGKWEYLEDSTHYLRGQVIPLEPLPNWLVRE